MLDGIGPDFSDSGLFARTAFRSSSIGSPSEVARWTSDFGSHRSIWQRLLSCVLTV